MKLVLSIIATALLFLPSVWLRADSPEPYRALRIAIPETAPTLDASPENTTMSALPVLRGQSRISGAVIEELESSLPPPGNLVNSASIPVELLMESPDSPTVNPVDSSQKPLAPNRNPSQTTDRQTGGDLNERLAGTWVMLYAVVATSLFVYFFIVACEYRQRWMASLTDQNNRLTQSIDAMTDGIVSESNYSAAEPTFALGESEPLFGSIRFGES